MTRFRMDVDGMTCDSCFGSLPFSEAKRYGVKFGSASQSGGEIEVRTLPSPLLAELGQTLPAAVAGDLWKPA